MTNSPIPDSFGEKTTDPIDSDDFKFEKTKVDEDSAKERLGRDIYTDETQAFEELYSNAVTAIYEAGERDYIDIDEGIIKIDVSSDEDGNVRLQVWDNGIGMDEKTVREVFLNFGITTGSSKEDVVAQFGMGVASYTNLVGFHDGRIYMETNPRYSDESLHGYFTIDGLSYKLGSDDLKLLDEEKYGTAFEMWLKEDITVSDVKNWISRVSGYNELPIEVSYPGDVTEIIEPSTVYDKFDAEDTIYIEYEDEEIGKFVAGMEVPSDTVLIHREIDFSLTTQKTNKKPPFKENVFIRLYTESEKVCEGKYKGKLVIDDIKYKNKPENLKDKYIPRSKVPENVAVTPRVVGNREKLTDEHNFSDWVVDKLRQAYYKKTEKILDNIKSTEDYFNMSLDDQNFLHLVMSNNVFSYSYRYTNYKDKMNDKYTTEGTKSMLDDKHTSKDYTVSEDVSRTLSAIFDTKDIMEVYNTTVGEKGISIERERQRLNTNVYMGVSINSKKKKVVIEDDPNAIVVKIRKSNQYERYEQSFGWKKLKKVTKNTLDNFDISEETKNLFKNKAKTISKSDSSISAPTEELTIHYGRRRIQKKKMTAQYVKENLENHNGSGLYSLPIVAFPENSKRNISDFYRFANKNSGLFKCKNETWKALEQYEQVKHIDSIIEEHKSATAMSDVGEVSVEMAIENTNYYTLLIPDENYNNLTDIFGEQETVKRFQKVMTVGTFGRKRHQPKSNINVLLLPESKLKENHFVLHNSNISNFYSLKNADVSSDLIGGVSNYSHKGYNRIKAHLMLAEWANTEIYEEIVNNINNFKNKEEFLLGIRKSMENNHFTETTDINDVSFTL